MSRILVTGASGYVGSHAVDYLARRGHEVVGTWRRDGGGLDRIRGENFSLEQVELADARAVERLVSPGRFDAIVHAAATIDDAESADNLRRSIKDNVQGHTNLVAAALNASCRRFLFCSSISVYGGAGAGASGYLEPDARPAGIYGWSKLAGEQVLDLAASLDTNFTAVSLRLAGIHGAGRKNGALYKISDAARKGIPISLMGADSRFRWLLIDDLMAALATLADASLPARHHVCNLASADTFTLRWIAERIKNLCRSSSVIEASDAVVRDEVMNIDRAISLWGFAPTHLDSFLPAYLHDFAIEA